MAKAHKEQVKTFKNKNLILISAAVLIFAVAFIYMFPISPKTGPMIINNNQPSSSAQTFTTTGAEMLAKETTQTMPYYESVTLEAGRYAVQVTSSTPVWIRVYDQIHFDAWKNSGEDGSAKTGTNLAVSDKVTDFNKNFDVGTGEEGKYYLVITGEGSSSLQLKITQILKF
jgi:hypothetical protein